jgi:hypothetical protein
MIPLKIGYHFTLGALWTRALTSSAAVIDRGYRIAVSDRGDRSAVIDRGYSSA